MFTFTDPHPAASKIYAYLLARSPGQVAGWVMMLDITYCTGEREHLLAQVLPGTTGSSPTSLRLVETTCRAYLDGLRAARSVSKAESVLAFPGRSIENRVIVGWHTFEEAAHAKTDPS